MCDSEEGLLDFVQQGSQEGENPTSTWVSNQNVITKPSVGLAQVIETPGNCTAERITRMN